MESPYSVLAFNAPLEIINGNQPGPTILPVLCRLYLAANILQFDVEPRFSALVFLHRYATAIGEEELAQYKTISDWKWVGAACLFLACKADEEPRRLRDVINLAEMLFLNEDMENNWITMSKNPPGLNDRYWEAKKKVVETEQMVLRWIMFNISVAHPHRAVVLLLEKETQKELLIPVAFRHLNDALFHSPALTFGVLEMAVAAIELAEEEVQIGTAGLNLQQRCNLSKEAASAAKLAQKEAANLLKQYKDLGRFLKP